MIDESCRPRRSTPAGSTRSGVEDVRTATARVSERSPTASADKRGTSASAVDRRQNLISAPLASDQAGGIPDWAFRSGHQGLLKDAVVGKRVRPGAAEQVRPNALTPLMAVEQAATILHLSTKTVRRLIARGVLSPVRIGRSVRIREEDIARIVVGAVND